MNQTELEDLFCFRQESARLLLLCMTQLSLSVKQSDDSMLSLTAVFQNLVSICASLEKYDAQLAPEQQAALQQIHQSINENVSDGIVAFQFYDRLSQQLEHVQKSLDELSVLIQDSDNLADSKKWLALREHICSSYSMESEHLIYKAIMDGMSAQDAMSLYLNQASKEDDIELF